MPHTLFNGKIGVKNFPKTELKWKNKQNLGGKKKHLTEYAKTTSTKRTDFTGS